MIKKVTLFLFIGLLIFSCSPVKDKIEIREIQVNYNKSPNLYARYFVVAFENNNRKQIQKLIDSVYFSLKGDSNFNKKVAEIKNVELWFIKEDEYIKGMDTINHITDNLFIDHKTILRKYYWFDGGKNPEIEGEY